MSKEKYICLVNEEEQYSLWLNWKKIPIGWSQIGPTGTKEECLAYIKDYWTDIRPKSLRVQMSQLEPSK